MESLNNAIRSIEPMLIRQDKAMLYLSQCAKVDPTKLKAGEDLEKVMEMIFGKRQQLVKAGAIAVIPVHGVIGNGLSPIESMMGALDVADLGAMIEDVEADPSIETVIFDFNSPGGTVTGVPEMAAKMRSMLKRTIGFTDDQSASASMWLMAQCDEVYCTPSASVGSIGVYVPVYDESKAYESAGVDVDVISSGWAKGAGFPGTKLTKEQRKLIQEDVVEFHNWFKSDVKMNRVNAKDEDMEGQSWSGVKAAEKGLVDGLVSDFDELITAVSWEQYYVADRSARASAMCASAAESKKDDDDEDDEDDKKKKKEKPSDDDLGSSPPIEAKA